MPRLFEHSDGKVEVLKVTKVVISGLNYISNVVAIILE